MRCATQVVANAVVADREGFDAFVIGHFQDSGLVETRSAVGIPVIGMGEATMLHACTLGRTIGLITIDPQFIPWHQDQIARYGLGDRVVAVRALSIGVAEFMAAFGDPDAHKDAVRRFEQEALPLVEAGVEVIVPAGGLPAALLRDHKNFTIGGAVVLNSIAVTAKQSEMAVKLRYIDGTNTSRAGTFVRPSDEALKEFLDLTARGNA
jgi:Asp/Glu/hydantoin racemase